MRPHDYKYHTCGWVTISNSTSKSAAVPLLGSTAPNAHASRWLPSSTNLNKQRQAFNMTGYLREDNTVASKLQNRKNWDKRSRKNQVHNQGALLKNVQCSKNIIKLTRFMSIPDLSGSSEPRIVAKTLRIGRTVWFAWKGHDLQQEHLYSMTAWSLKSGKKIENCKQLMNCTSDTHVILIS